MEEIVKWSLSQTIGLSVSLLFNIVCVIYIIQKDKLISKLNNDILQASKDTSSALSKVSELFVKVMASSEKGDIVTETKLLELSKLSSELKTILHRIEEKILHLTNK